jgi:hypothetical protein
MAGAEKIFAADRAERSIRPRVDNARGGQNLPGIGRPDDPEFVLPVHLLSSAADGSMLVCFLAHQWCVK